MPYYRVSYTASETTPHFDEFEAANDIEAVRSATRFVAARPAELWCGERLVMKFNAE